MLKFNYGQYWWNPSNDISTAAIRTGSPWFRRYAWTDRNGNGSWDEGEQGTCWRPRAACRAPSSIRISRTTYTRELSGWFEHELAPNFGVRTGVVMRQIRNQRANRDANRPFDAFNVPATFPDPGLMAAWERATMVQPINGFNLQSSATGFPRHDRCQSPDARGDYYTWEVRRNRRMAGRWSLRASFTHTWNYDHGNSYAGSTVRQYSLPSRPTISSTPIARTAPTNSRTGRRS